MINEKPDGEKSGLLNGYILGRWEWVALPAFGVGCMKAILTPDTHRSTLACEDLHPSDLDGAARLRFRIFPLADDPRTFIIAEAPCTVWSEEPAEKAMPTIRTLLTLGDRTWPVELDLVPRSGPSQPLTLGRAAFGKAIVDLDRVALAGLPGCRRDVAEPGSSDKRR